MKALLIPLLFINVFVNDDLMHDGSRLYCVEIPNDALPVLLEEYAADDNRFIRMTPEYPYEEYDCNTFCHPRPMQYRPEETSPYSWTSVYHAENPLYPPNSWGGLLR